MATRSRKRLPGVRSGSLVRADSLRWRKADSSPWSPLHRRRLRDRPWRLVRIRVPAGETNSFTGGTDGSNPLSSSGESSMKHEVARGVLVEPLHVELYRRVG